ncbi:hypothetical protein [Allosphingosinicella deserti]|nr:hypothetical protein [Sphingomonas deserti]
MKAAAFTMALLLSGAAIAQTTDTAAGAGSSVGADTSATMSTDTGTQTGSALSSVTGAQTGTATTSDSDGQGGETTDAAAAGDISARTGSSVNATLASSSQMVEPHNANPERDARGIRVVSAAAMVPAGFNGTAGGTATGGPLLDPATGQAVSDQQSYPACSSSVTDKCLQSYERGRKS